MNLTYVAEPKHIWSWNDGSSFMRPSEAVEQWLLANVGKEMVFSSKWGWKGKWRAVRINGLNHFAFADPKKAMMYKLVWSGT